MSTEDQIGLEICILVGGAAGVAVYKRLEAIHQLTPLGRSGGWGAGVVTVSHVAARLSFPRSAKKTTGMTNSNATTMISPARIYEVVSILPTWGLSPGPRSHRVYHNGGVLS